LDGAEAFSIPSFLLMPHRQYHAGIAITSIQCNISTIIKADYQFAIVGFHSGGSASWPSSNFESHASASICAL
jgi:hypothetical protein